MIGNFQRLRWLSFLIAPAALAGFLFVLHRLLAEYHYRDIVNEVKAIDRSQLIVSIILCAANYLVLTLYDTAAFRYVRHTLAYPRIALTAFVSYTFSHNLGFAAVSGSAIRYRLYSAWGVSPADIARVIAFSGLNFWLGLFLLGGLSCLSTSVDLALLPFLGGIPVQLLGVLLLLPVVAYLILSMFRRTPFAFHGVQIETPTPALALEAVVVASIDWLLAASVLYALLPPAAEISFPQVLSAFFLAQIAGVLSHIPGGLGVFETVMVLLLHGSIKPETVLGTLLLYRVVYYILPFTIGASLLVAWEVAGQRAGRNPRFTKAVALAGRWLASVIPVLLSISAFISGAILLLSGATPTEHDRLRWLRDVLPLSFIEASHFINSIVGVALLILSWGIQKRIDLAYRLTLLLLVAGIVVSLTKGFDYEEATILGITLITFLPCHKYFRRPSSLLASGNVKPLIAPALVLLCSFGLGLFSFKHVEYANDLWWKFTIEGDAPRFMRASVGAALVLLAIAFARVMRPLKTKPHLPTEDELRTVSQILQKVESTTAFVALTRDKSLLFSEDQRAFLMYRVEGKSWIVMGDPVGEADACVDLAWSFRELCDLQDVWPVFYEVRAETLPNYLDLGLRLYKLGEEAIVPLESFSLEGSAARDFRHTLRKLEKEGCTFSIREVSQLPTLMPQLRAVSDRWLSEKRTREKGFSVGFFDETYLSHFPVALVEREGQILAFANIWPTENKAELSIDLMRHIEAAPNGIMDYLFIQLMLWGKANGFRQFNLGMAPLSGLENRPLAPLWTKLGSYAYRHGDQFYNFDGLRRYKEKFHPRWEPKYLAAPGGWKLPLILTNIATVISRGFGGVAGK